MIPLASLLHSSLLLLIQNPPVAHTCFSSRHFTLLAISRHSSCPSTQNWQHESPCAMFVFLLRWMKKKKGFRETASIAKIPPNAFQIRKTFCGFFFYCVVVLMDVRCMQSHRCLLLLYYCKMNIIVITIIIIHPIQTLISKYTFCLLFNLFNFSHLSALILTLRLNYTSSQKCYTDILRVKNYSKWQTLAHINTGTRSYAMQHTMLVPLSIHWVSGLV